MAKRLRITLEHLNAGGACSTYLERFAKAFPKGVLPHEDLLKTAHEWNLICGPASCSTPPDGDVLREELYATKYSAKDLFRLKVDRAAKAFKKKWRKDPWDVEYDLKYSGTTAAARIKRKQELVKSHHLHQRMIKREQKKVGAAMGPPFLAAWKKYGVKPVADITNFW
jgi:hypothetical protein